MKYYIKQASVQDVTKTTVINEKAAKEFFGFNLTVRDQEEFIDITYIPGGEVIKTRIVRKQDIRIFIRKGNLEKGDLMYFSKDDSDMFFLRFIKTSDSDYHEIKSKLTGNFLLTDIGFEVIKTKMTPVNTILYGPPGTGKTYTTVEKALEILNKLSKETDPVKNAQKNRELFRSLLNKRIFFVTMHPSYSYEDFVQGIKPCIKTSTSQKRIVIVTHIQDDKANDAVSNYKEDINKEYIYDNLVSNHKLIEEDNIIIVRDRENVIGYAEVKKIESDSFVKKLAKCPNCGKADLRKRKKTKPKYLCVDCRAEFDVPDENNITVTKYTAIFDQPLVKVKVSKKNIESDIIKFNPQVSIQEAKPSILDKIGFKIPDGEKLFFKYKDGVFMQVCRLAHLAPDDNFVIILDEINRANISKVFGELITLIEDDKRLGAKNEITVILPSGETFRVPPNLYIIGTMNTADKSIALVDIALRRRFQFIPVYPDADIIDKCSQSTDKAERIRLMKNLNENLRKEKGVDFQIGHAYFIKDNSLEEVINQNIIPLLTEYFRNDLEKVKKVMSETGIAADEDYYNNTGLLRYTSS